MSVDTRYIMGGSMAVSEAASMLNREADGLRTKEESGLRDSELVASLQLGRPEARAALFDAYGEYVERLLIRVLGRDPEIEDLLHDVFVQALANIRKLRDPSRLKAWLGRMTVFVARGALRRRRRGNWLVFMPAQELPDQKSSAAPHETLDLLDRVFAVLRGLHPNDRIAFSLRYIEGLTLPEAADASGVSLATFKRWLQRSDKAFLARAQRNDRALYDTLLETPRWGSSHG